MTEPLWYQVYSYDQYGNHAITDGLRGWFSQPESLSDYDPNTNRNILYRTYDAAGNLTLSGDRPYRTYYYYDAENRQLEEYDEDTSHRQISYVYDNKGQKVRQIYYNSENYPIRQEIYVYNAFDQLRAVYYLGGSRAL